MGKKKNQEIRERIAREQAQRDKKMGWTLGISGTALGVIVVAFFVVTGNAVVAAPSWEATTTDDEPVSSEQLQGSAYVLDFKAINCGICERQRPYNQGLIDAMEDRDDFHFISVLSDPRDTLERIEEHRNENNITWPHIRDTYRLFQEFDVRGDPFMVFVDREGNIAQVVMQITHTERLIEIAERVLEEGATGSPSEMGRPGHPPQSH